MATKGVKMTDKENCLFCEEELAENTAMCLNEQWEAEWIEGKFQEWDGQTTGHRYIGYDKFLLESLQFTFDGDVIWEWEKNI
jgi:hypothetical protein